jgi:hypothetical protein
MGKDIINFDKERKVEDWLRGKRPDLPIFKDFDEVKMPESITVCWECGKITEGFHICDKCQIRADAQMSEMREDD